MYSVSEWLHRQGCKSIGSLLSAFSSFLTSSFLSSFLLIFVLLHVYLLSSSTFTAHYLLSSSYCSISLIVPLITILSARLHWFPLVTPSPTSYFLYVCDFSFLLLIPYICLPSSYYSSCPFSSNHSGSSSFLFPLSLLPLLLASLPCLLVFCL